MVDGELWIMNKSVKFEDWKYIDSTGSGNWWFID